MEIIPSLIHLLKQLQFKGNQSGNLSNCARTHKHKRVTNQE